MFSESAIYGGDCQTNIVAGEEEEDMEDELRPMYGADELNELVSAQGKLIRLSFEFIRII